MKKILLLLTLLFASFAFSQTSGITYQAIVYSPTGEPIPGYNNANAPLANRNVCLLFTISDANSQIEYQEKITITTDEFGMVNTIIGSGDQTDGYATSFSGINWSVAPKSLKVALDTNGQCFNFIEISNQPFSYVPFAFAANSAANVTGIVPIANGGTNATTVLGAKTNLGLENVDNTSDLNKPVSIATQTALNLKENAANKSTDATLSDVANVKFPTELAVKTYVTGQISTANSTLNASIAAVQADVNQNELDSDAVDATLLNNINTLNTTVAANATAANSAIALKENAANKSTDVTLTDVTNTKFPTELAVKTFVNGQITTVNASNTALQATVAANAAAANTAIAAVQADVNQNELDSDAVDAVLQTNINTLNTTVAANATTANTAIAAVQADVNQNELDSDAIDVTLQTNINALNTTVAANATAANTAIAAVQADVNQNELDSDAVDATLQNNINTLNTTVVANATAANTAIALKENAANKSTDATLSDLTNVKFPTELAVKTFVNNQVTNGTATNVSGIVAIPNGGTGSATQNFVDLTTNQTIAGDKTFSTNINAPGFKTPSGTATEFLKADGSVDSNSYLILNSQNPVAIGYVAGTGGQAANAIAIGNNAAQGPQATGAIGIGIAAAQYNQGENSIAIGAFAGNNGQHDNSIVLNATGNALHGSANSGLYIDPIRSASGSSSLFYDTTTKEVTYGSTPAVSLTSSVTGILPIANGGTGSATQNFVDLITNQSIDGLKAFNSDVLVNGLTVGRGLGNISTNTVVGKEILGVNTTGFYNTALGVFTLKNNIEGSRNTAVGGSALFSNNGYDNTAFGYMSLLNNTTGNYNVSVGSGSLSSNTTGGFNTALGSNTLKSNINGTGNTAIGNNSLLNNTSGSNNTVSGSSSLYSNTTGTYNSAFGVQSLEQNTTGNQNTAIGVAAIDRNTTGANNAVLGAFAGRYISDGVTSNTIINNSVLIGANTRPNGNNETNQIVIGSGGIGNGSNTVQLGNISITNVKTSGTITADAVTYPKAHGTSGQVLSTTGSGTLTWLTPSTTATAFSGTLPVANGGTGSSTQNFMDLTTAQTVGGAKTFSSNVTLPAIISNGDILVNGITIGSKNGGASNNTLMGKSALISLSSGIANTAIGSLAMYASNGSSNTAVGSDAMRGTVSGDGNTAIGSSALGSSVSGSRNTGIGGSAMTVVTGNDNASLGYFTGKLLTTGSQNTFIGVNADVLAVANSALVNSTAIGYNAKVSANNSIQLGNLAVTNVKTSGTITAGAITIPNTDGTSGQALVTNGSGTITWETPAANVREVADEFTATVSQTSFTLTQTKSANSKVKMYINGIRISNTAYSISGTTLTYVPANNGTYTLTAGDRIQFDYFY